ncbi:ribosome biogenesis GTP-binding protein YihA/YsxC [Cardinium endosymbiont of Oedothorax gibbosus]|uniref:ribosome biogenesis GTP-binding protein YihA/YsxC n=1 Tax=Cardinium endosymbiont of Oedothorax gibbosus TaxID=931101 RepID=UPI002111BF6E|nr:ribosome biogenesis GTP-binding protein YihA/YsxC [Cardinium endosymbiont of Oedothorax gibbosus]CAH2560016.1 Probable GTP-binding protein EngB [Cardinium endosymbiont of Oedothorax gibbosus]
MKIYSSCLVSSNASYKMCPHDAKPEVAFIGRSNVGKSSLINAILQRKQLARVSKMPGKTKLIHHFLVNHQIYFVDLPGYGWAQVGHVIKIKWEKMLREYLLHRPNMVTVFLLIDAKIAPQAIDLECIDWLGAHHIPFAIVLTKADKKHKMVVQKHYIALTHVLQQDWATMPPFFFVSAHNRLGMETILGYIQTVTQSKRSN